MSGPLFENLIRPDLKKIDALFSPYDKPGEPGFAIAVLKDGRTFYQRGFGSKRLGVHDPLTPRSVCNLGSVSKQFTAFCLLLLQDEGRLSIEDSVRKHIPEFPQSFAPIKLRHLLHHSSGLLSTLDMLWVRAAQGHFKPGGLTTVRLLARMKERNFEPGGEFCYSNDGYLLLAEIIRRRSGQSLAVFARARVFEPLGMRHTHVLERPDSFLPEKVEGYRRDKKKRWMAAPKVVCEQGASDVWSNLEDLARWERNFFERRVGSPAVFRALFKPAVYRRKLLGDAGYAGGLELDQLWGRDFVGHDGFDTGACAYYHRHPETGLALMMLSNSENAPTDKLWGAMRLAMGLKDEPVRKLRSRKLLPPQRAAAGFYLDETKRVLYGLQTRPQGFLLRIGMAKQEMLHMGRGVFRIQVDKDLRIRLDAVPGKAPTLRVYWQGSLRRRMHWLGRPSTKIDGLKQLPGIYRHPVSRYEHQLKRKGDKLYFLHPYWTLEDDEPVLSLGPDQLVMRTGLLLNIERDTQGHVVALNEFEPQGRCKRLRLLKVRGSR